MEATPGGGARDDATKHVAVERYYTAIDRSGLHTMSDPTAPEPPRGWKGSGRYGQPIPGEIPGGPKPIVWRGMVLNSKVRTLAKDENASLSLFSQTALHNVYC